MDNINIEIYNSLTRYFTRLSQIGYVNYKEVEKLLVFLYIQEILEGNSGVESSEEDLNIMHRALYCLYGNSCLFPYTESPLISDFINSNN